MAQCQDAPVTSSERACNIRLIVQLEQHLNTPRQRSSSSVPVLVYITVCLSLTAWSQLLSPKTPKRCRLRTPAAGCTCPHTRGGTYTPHHYSLFLWTWLHSSQYITQTFCGLYLLPQYWDREPGTPEKVEQEHVSIPRPNPTAKLYTGHCHRYIKAPKMELLKSFKWCFETNG